MRKLLLGLLGAGIQRSLSPALHEEEGRQLGLRLHYQLIDTGAAAYGADRLSDLIAAMRVIGFDGFNVTYPFKQSILPLLDALSDEAQSIGAVNTVVREGDRWIGYNTDGSGWSWGFRRALPHADLSRVVLIGAGGAGSACADAVLRLGALQVLIHDQHPARAAMLAQRLNRRFDGDRAAPSDDLRDAIATATGLIHATPTGMDGHPGVPFPVRWLHAGIWVSEIVYVPLTTALLRHARDVGCPTVDGGHMNVGQAVRCFRLFTGREADATRVDAFFRRIASGG